MRLFCLVILLATVSIVNSRDRYTIYLQMNQMQQLHFEPHLNSRIEIVVIAFKPVPKYIIPKGSVFCRLEDYLTRKTKIWIKVGVK